MAKPLSKLMIAAAALATAQGCAAPSGEHDRGNGMAVNSSPGPAMIPEQPSATTAPTSAPVSQPRFLRGPGAFITEADYPAAALQARQQGTVRFRLNVSAEGRVTGCTILQSSGSSALDSTTCQLMQRRARFTPVRDSAGNRVPASLEEQYTWMLPAGG
jgi:protein TonB